METVYRIESKVSGRGIYNHNHEVAVGDVWLKAYETHFANWYPELLWNSPERPHPHFDGLINFTERHYFGFDSFSQMMDWFPKGILSEIVDGVGSDWFCVVAYTVEEEFVLHGGRQVAFEKAQAYLRHELTKDELSWLL